MFETSKILRDTLSRLRSEEWSAKVQKSKFGQPLLKRFHGLQPLLSIHGLFLSQDQPWIHHPQVSWASSLPRLLASMNAPAAPWPSKLPCALVEREVSKHGPGVSHPHFWLELDLDLE